MNLDVSNIIFKYWSSLFPWAFPWSLKDIAMMEEELKTKTERIKKQERLIQGWRKELKDQLEKHKTELERV